MRILHAFSNWKWTGPAEPAVRLAAMLALRHSVDFACGRCPYPDLENRVRVEAERHGLEVLSGLRLQKHLHPISGVRDVRRLVEVVRERRFDVIHAHLLNDHLLAGAAARRARTGAVVVRTVYGGPDVEGGWRRRLAFRRLTDGVIAASDAAAVAVAVREEVPIERRFVIAGAVDVERFARARLDPLRAAARAELGLSDDEVVGGIVARVQRHRRYELLFDALARAVEAAPSLRVVVIGRGTHLEEIAVRPIERLGLERHVVLAGYREGESYDAVVAALDFGLFLVPGSDASCRAARELVAASLPMVVTRRPPLPEIVAHGETGFVVDEEVGALAAALVEVARDAALRRRMAAAGRRRSEERFSLARQALDVEAAYERVRALGVRSGR